VLFLVLFATILAVVFRTVKAARQFELWSKTEALSFGVLLAHRKSRFIGFTVEGERISTRRAVSPDCETRQRALEHGLVGRLKVAAIPTALVRCRRLLTRYRAGASRPGVPAPAAHLPGPGTPKCGEKGYALIDFFYRGTQQLC